MTEGTIEMRPTMNFRWIVRCPPGIAIMSPLDGLCTRFLQQQFINTATGQTEWRDVPVVEET